jgi:DNA (cytosine-5)-methyltransferase 1
VDYRGGSGRGTDTPWYEGWQLTDEARATFRATTIASQEAKRRAMRGEGDAPLHPINKPRLDPLSLMPQLDRHGLRALSLFSGGGGLDIGFDRSGFNHVASYEIMDGAARVLSNAHPDWKVFGGRAGDVTQVDWSPYRGQVDVLHGGPPCQPFSHAGKRRGANDVRDMIPELVRAVRATQPRAFVCENVSGLATKRFADYVQSTIYGPLRGSYVVQQFCLDAADFGVPQRRRRIFFVGFKNYRDAARFEPPSATHSRSETPGLQRTVGAREALGLPDIGKDDLAPTLRSGLTGPRHTTSILNSVTAQQIWSQLQIWPNGVARTRAEARAYVVKNGHFRLSVPDCMILQGFPTDWPVEPPVYFALGLIGNSVAPPMGYRVASAIRQALS